MNKKTIKDLESIKLMNNQINDLYDSINKIKEECAHLDIKIECRETFAYSHSPMKVCLVCDTQIARGAELTREERFKAYQEALDWLPEHELMSLSKEFGYNS